MVSSFCRMINPNLEKEKSIFPHSNYGLPQSQFHGLDCKQGVGEADQQDVQKPQPTQL